MLRRKTPLRKRSGLPSATSDGTLVPMRFRHRVASAGLGGLNRAEAGVQDHRNQVAITPLFLALVPGCGPGGAAVRAHLQHGGTRSVLSPEVHADRTLTFRPRVPGV